jgi:integrase
MLLKPTEATAMLLSQYVDRYTLERDISLGREKQIRIAVRSLEQYCGRKLRTSELTDTCVSLWLKSRQHGGLSPHTVAGNRRILVALWRAAAESGLAPPLGKVRTIRCPDVSIRAFTHDDLRLLVAEAEKLRGTFRTMEILRRLYWRSYLMASYDSALRRCDMLSLSKRDIFRNPDGSGFLSFVQRKTGRTHHVGFRAETMRAIDECCGTDNRYLIWPQWAGRRQWFRAFKSLCEAAGVSGSSKFVRRAAASYAERDRPGSGRALLGHRTGLLFQQSYEDKRITTPVPVMPPPIG